MSTLRWMAIPALLAAAPAAAQPRLHPLLPDTVEISLARSAAPAALSDDADIWVLRRGGHVKVVEGTNGAACMVARDHPESLYPICYDRAAAATVMQSELYAQRLRERGVWGDSLKAAMSAAFERGELRAPEKLAVVYMMSPFQVLYAGEDGQRVGRWHPHLMIHGPGAGEAGLTGVPGGDLQVSNETGHSPNLVVFTHDWAVAPPDSAERR